MTVCYPDTVMCLLSRPHREGFSECVEVPAAYCSASAHHLSCEASAAECERVRDLLSTVLHAPAGPCVRYE
jgi:hypothetical protein